MTTNILKPTNLMIDLVSIATDVNEASLFGWTNHSLVAGDRQAAYEVIIARSAALVNAGDYLFDSGWVEGSNPSAVALATGWAKDLGAGGFYVWAVRVKNSQGEISEWSEPAIFTTAVDEIGGQGIWAPETTQTGQTRLPALGNYAFLRSPHFAVADDVEQVIVRAIFRGNESSLSQAADLYLNGESFGVGSARPYTYYHGSHDEVFFYNTYVITAAVQKADNVIAVLATGMQDTCAAFIEVLTLDQAGEVTTVAQSGTDWKALDGSAAFGDFGATMGSQYFQMPYENVDMTFYPQDWQERDFDDHSWAQAVAQPLTPSALAVSADSIVHSANETKNDNPEDALEAGRLLPFPSENTTRHLTDADLITITTLAPEDILIDLGREIIGGVAVDLNSPIAQRVVVKRGEQLLEDGHVRHQLAAEPNYIENWHLIAGRNQFTTMQMKNFRYIELVGYTGQLQSEDVRGWAMFQPFDETSGTFSSDNQLLNAEYELSKYTIQATNQDIYVDSQVRERRPYEGDLLVNANTSYGVSDRYSLARYSLDYLLDNPTWPEDYKLFNVEMAWRDYEYTGDARLLHSRYADLQDKLLRGEYPIDNHAPSYRHFHLDDNYNDEVGLVCNNGIIDWPIVERDGFVVGYYNTPLNAIYVGVYRIMAKIASVVGKPDDAKEYLRRADKIQQTMIERLYDKTTNRFYDSLNQDLTVNAHCSHHASAYALAYHVYQDQEMADQLAVFVANDGHFIGSVYFIYFMLTGLIDCGHGDEALQLLLDPDPTPNAKTFAAIIDNLQATIAPEAWSEKAKPNLTLSHPWGATPGLAIVQGVAGIKPLAPGFTKFAVRPQLGNLQKIDLKMPTLKGEIVVSATPQAVALTVPMDSQATLQLPLTADQTVVVDDQKVPYPASGIVLESGRHTVTY